MTKPVGFTEDALYELMPSDIGFDVSTWRIGQLEAIASAFTSKKHVTFINAPTGSGKTAIAIGIARAFAAQSMTSAIVTKTKQLQAQYMREVRRGSKLPNDGVIPLNNVKEMYGRSAYKCANGAASAADGICVFGLPCTHTIAKTCDYYNALNAASTDPIVIGNYDLLATHIQTNSKLFQEREILICDEGHLTEQSIRSAFTYTLTASQLAAIESSTGIYPPVNEDINSWLAYVSEVHQFLMTQLDDGDNPQQHLHTILAQMRNITHARMMKQIERIYLSIDTICSTPYMVTKSRDGNINFVPVFGTSLFANISNLFSRVIIMSATLLDIPTMAKLLNIPHESYDVINIESTFPSGNRPFYPLGTININHKLDDTGYARIVEQIDALLDEWKDIKGIVHANSYNLVSKIMNGSRHKKRLLTHGTGNIQRAIEQFQEAPGGTFIVSPSMHSGVDLPYDFVRAQIIVKLPMPDLSDKVVKARADIMPISYHIDVATTLVQAYGRGMRASDDSCVTVLLDGNWRWWAKHYANLLPGWMWEAVRKG